MRIDKKLTLFGQKIFLANELYGMRPEKWESLLLVGYSALGISSDRVGCSGLPITKRVCYPQIKSFFGSEILPIPL